MSDTPEHSILIGAPGPDFPPWTDAQRDAQIEALRFGYLELVKTLHEAGVLDMAKLNANLGNAEWIYAGKSPDTLQAVRRMSAALDDDRRRLGPLPTRRR